MVGRVAQRAVHRAGLAPGRLRPALVAPAHTGRGVRAVGLVRHGSLQAHAPCVPPQREIVVGHGAARADELDHVPGDHEHLTAHGQALATGQRAEDRHQSRPVQSRLPGDLAGRGGAVGQAEGHRAGQGGRLLESHRLGQCDLDRVDGLGRLVLPAPGVLPLERHGRPLAEPQRQPHVGRVREVRRGPAVAHVDEGAVLRIDRDHVRGLRAVGVRRAIAADGVAVIGPLPEDLGGGRVLRRVRVPAGRARGDQVVRPLALEERRCLAVRPDVGADEVHALDRALRRGGELGEVLVESRDEQGVVLLARVDDVGRPVVVEEDRHVAGHAGVVRLPVRLALGGVVQAVAVDPAEGAGGGVGDGHAGVGLRVLGVRGRRGAVGMHPHHPGALGGVMEHLGALEDRGGGGGPGGGGGLQIADDRRLLLLGVPVVEGEEVGVGVELLRGGERAQGEALVRPGVEVAGGVDVHAGGGAVAVAAVLAVPVVERTLVVVGEDDLPAVGLDGLPLGVEPGLTGGEGGQRLLGAAAVVAVGERGGGTDGEEGQGRGREGEAQQAAAAGAGRGCGGHGDSSSSRAGPALRAAGAGGGCLHPYRTLRKKRGAVTVAERPGERKGVGGLSGGSGRPNRRRLR